ncbi:DUF123 domain-containing protein [bacterium]|nr:DUF123 domain-containing protein [bacterium]
MSASASPISLEPLPAQAGTYALILHCSKTQTVRIGKKGDLALATGYYIYIGSAFGPGGVRARLAHHFHPANRPHWHIDYLRRVVAITEIWWVCSSIHHEHEWAAHLTRIRDVQIPLPRFGASDCRCPSHLFYAADRPKRSWFPNGSLKSLSLTVY